MPHMPRNLILMIWFFIEPFYLVLKPRNVLNSILQCKSSKPHEQPKQQCLILCPKTLNVLSCFAPLYLLQPWKSSIPPNVDTRVRHHVKNLMVTDLWQFTLQPLLFRVLAVLIFLKKVLRMIFLVFISISFSEVAAKSIKIFFSPKAEARPGFWKRWSHCPFSLTV